ncbi:phosphate signaling complex protein PhoU [Lactobacillus porci]|uniref:Phosphate-specific transport system accessory protein PhoU n=1 Tax=Lactobacillus porci TaxID=2012477 RepID=A0A6A8MGB9_9LACO|nr:phosphate signaling complex protein PhoU [Lactobacillus porci]MST87825.1 phosphate signaling complex protein PhoU [Lactobacillus porci]
MRTRFDDELDELHKAMVEIGQLCKDTITETTDTLFTGDAHEAKDSINLYHRIHKNEREIEDSCLRLLMQQQPVATDLRVISASLKAVYDLERIGEIAADISEMVINDHMSVANDMINLKEMSQTAAEMVNDSITSLVKTDKDLADTVIRRDDQVDGLFDQAKETLIKSFKENGNPEYLLNLLMVAKYFEKIGDHAVNIARWAKFVETGKSGR